MKMSILILSILLIAASISFAQDSKVINKEFKVEGNCNQCKTRIEKAVKAEGASNADWSTKTKLLTVTFDPAKTSVDSFSKKLASVGHDTEKYRADDKAYDALDSCCKYERKK